MRPEGGGEVGENKFVVVRGGTRGDRLPLLMAVERNQSLKMSRYLLRYE